MRALKDRFESFVQTFESFESVDALLAGRDPNSMHRADYLLWDRSVVVEQKVLESDPADKPQKFVDGLMEKRRLIAFGTVSTTDIFSKLPDGDRLNRQLFNKVTERIEKIFTHADKQTRDTRKIFSIENASGVLVILNEAAATLDPDLIGHRVAHLFNMTNDDGAPCYGNNSAAVIISEIHEIAGAHSSRLLPIMTIFGPGARQNSTLSRFSQEISQRWAAFNGLPLMSGNYRPGQAFRPSKRP